MTSATDADPQERTYEVPREQRGTEGARRFAEAALDCADLACREAVTMAVSEFAENLVKYAFSAEGAAGTIAIRVKGTGVRIRVKNVVRSQEDAEHVMGMIDEIGAAPNVGDLYCLRQRELFLDPNLPRVRLGLLRVAFEGGFQLSCSYAAPVLEITAERS